MKVSVRRDLELSLICCNWVAKALRWQHNAAIPTKRAKTTPITIPAVSPLDRVLLLLTPDAAFVVGGEEAGVDDDVGEEAVRTVEDNVVLVPAGESTRMLGVAAGVCVGGGEAGVV
jgi:tRNA(Leu) C34 or U34 (ribose-2'-O)-methylase TrmL